MVRAQLIEKLKHNTLDTIIAVGHRMHPTHVELFTMSDSKWDIKKDYTTDTIRILYDGYQFLLAYGCRKNVYFIWWL